MRCSARETVFHPLHKDSVEAPGFVVRISRDSREAAPFTGSLPENAIFTIWRRRPIEEGGILCDERGTCRQCVLYFLSVGCWMLVGDGLFFLGRRLSVEDACEQKQGQCCKN